MINVFVLNNTYIMGPTTVLTLRYGMNTFRDDNALPFDFDTHTFGWNKAFADAIPVQKFPSFAFTSYGSTGYSGKTWNILGQVYFPKAVTDSTFAFETNSDPGQFVPVHIHPTQDEFILVQDGRLDLKLDGVWVQANAGDLVRLPRLSVLPVPADCWQRLEALAQPTLA